MLKLIGSKIARFHRPPLLSTSHVFSTNRDANDLDRRIDDKKEKNPLKRFIIDKIRVSGPITVAEYMQICAGSSTTGYYSKKSGEIFGERGDFVTSPEFTQMLGELIGVWAVYEVFKLGHRGHWQLVELGPGNGTLISDVLKVLCKFRLADNVSVHLVETSERLVKKQASLLCNVETPDIGKKSQPGENACKLSLPSKFGPAVHWYDDLTEVPSKFAVTLAHEFFDALPVHKFRKTKYGWREVFVTTDEKRENLVFSLAPGVSLSQKAHFKEVYGEHIDDVEISPYSATILQTLSSRISENGGAGLIIDYGHVGDKGDTLRAFSRHRVVDPLSNPGEIDLTADVNFAYFMDVLNKPDSGVFFFGPINQADFLKNLGLQLRFEQLMKSAKNDTEKTYLTKCYDVLTNPREMGERFKALALFPKVLENFLLNSPPAGFHKLQ